MRAHKKGLSMWLLNLHILLQNKSHLLPPLRNWNIFRKIYCSVPFAFVPFRKTPLIIQTFLVDHVPVGGGGGGDYGGKVALCGPDN